jgi:hypothetical protein
MDRITDLVEAMEQDEEFVTKLRVMDHKKEVDK